jgi:sepiapterin reductase
MNSPVILVTGAGKGIGRSVVESLIARRTEFNSPRLMLVSRTKNDLDSLQSLATENGLECLSLPMSLETNPSKVVTDTIQKFGRLDILIHSAGVGRFGNFLELTRDDVEYTMRTNTEATFFLFQAAYAQMKSQDPMGTEAHRGDIVCVTSVAAQKPFEQSAAYCMSKYAQRGLLEVMRLYGRQDGIRVMDVKPGATFTPMWGEVPDALKAKMMHAKDIAEIIIATLLLHPRASTEEIVIRPLNGDL